MHTYYNVSSFSAGSFSGRHPARRGFADPVCVDSAKGMRTDQSIYKPCLRFYPPHRCRLPGARVGHETWDDLAVSPVQTSPLDLELQDQTEAGAGFSANQEMAVITLVLSCAHELPGWKFKYCPHHHHHHSWSE